MSFSLMGCGLFTPNEITFADEAGRNAHLNGKVAAALMEKASELFAEAPDIKKLEILTAKVGDSTKTKASNS